MMGVHFQISTMQVVAKRTALILVPVLAQPDPRPNLTSRKSTCYFPVGALGRQVDRATSKIPQVCGLIVLARNMCVEGMGVAFGDSQTRVVRTVRLDLSDGFKLANAFFLNKKNTAKGFQDNRACPDRMSNEIHVSRQRRLHGALGAKSGAHQEIQDSHCCPGKCDALFRVVMAYDS